METLPSLMANLAIQNQRALPTEHNLFPSQPARRCGTMQKVRQISLHMGFCNMKTTAGLTPVFTPVKAEQKFINNQA